MGEQVWIHVRIRRELLNRLDHWRIDHGRLTRREAVERLLSEALDAKRVREWPER